MEGTQLKYILLKSGVSQTELAERLGMSQQSFHQALKVKDIKTGFLEKLCEVLDVNMSFFYPDAYAPEVEIHHTHQDAGAINAQQVQGSVSSGASDDTVKLLIQQNQQLLDMLKDKL